MERVDDDEDLASGAPPTEAEHMTVDVGPGGYPPDAEHGGAPRARGSFVGGFMRKILGKGARPETSGTEYEHSEYAGAPPPESAHGRNVTYVETTEMPEDPPLRRPLYSQYTGASGLPSVQEQDSPEMRDHRSDLGSEHARSHERGSHEEADIQHYDQRSHEGTAMYNEPEAADIDGTTAVHHGVPFQVAMMNSPVFNEPLPTSDYDKMSAFHTAPSELYSLTSYVDRVALFFRDLYDLPWMSSRVAADYIPGENSRSKYYRFKMRHQTQNGSLGLNSWYALPTHQDLDLLEGEGSQRSDAAGPARHPYPGAAYVYPANYPTAYPYIPPEPRYGYEYPGSSGTADEREQMQSPPQSQYSHGEPQDSQHSHRVASPPAQAPVDPGRAPRVTIQAASPPRSYGSPRNDRMAPALSHAVRSPGYGDSSTLAAMSPRTDQTIDTHSHTAFSTPRGPGRERGTAAGTAGSDVSARDGGGGQRRSRVSWYSNEATPTTPTQPMFNYGQPGSPPRPGPSSLARRVGGSSLSGRSDRSGGGPRGNGAVRSANGSRSDSGSAPGGWPSAVPQQMQQMPVMLEPSTPSPPASPPRLAANLGSPRRNRYDHYAGNGYASPSKGPLPFAMNRA